MGETAVGIAAQAVLERDSPFDTMLTMNSAKHQLPENVEISIDMRGVGGTLRYVNGSERLEIPVENTGDYARGILVFVRELEAQIKGPAAQQRKSQVLRDLQVWSKVSGNKLCW